jgi:glycosyltransferase involved in cell wall biosynthesis
VKTLAEELPKQGCEVKVVTYSDEVRCKKSEVRSEGPIYFISRRQNILIRYFQYFLQVYRLASWADVIYVQDPVCAGLPVWLAAKLKGKPYFLKIVGDYAWEQGRQKFGVSDTPDLFQEKKYGLNVEILRQIERRVAKDAQKIITPSAYLKKIVTAWGIADERIRVIYNSVKEIDLSPLRKDEIKKELKISGDMILSAGRLVPWKGFPRLIDIMPELLKINPSFILVIAGEGPERKNLEEQINNLNLGQNVKLTGILKQEGLWNYMQAADLFVLNTQYEGLPHIVIEAMKCGLPVIASKAGGNPEVIRDKVSGWLVNYNDEEQIKNAVLSLCRDKDLARSMAENAREEVRDKFDKRSMIFNILEELKSV